MGISGSVASQRPSTLTICAYFVTGCVVSFSPLNWMNLKFSLKTIMLSDYFYYHLLKYYSYMQFCYPFVCINDFIQCISVDFKGIFVSRCTGQVQSSTVAALSFSYSSSTALPEKKH